ncbi:hypothetical protein G7Y89_g505 [Cudoniella acicularis]|uniref:Fungal lipase-type domain-containing protein n=1 Tax=Cudoniella acicularis TaxID=354080 RepID=A0A8H4RZ16_9HELO|nr:hypothetical protein G7Y89_g505 [Cudoniella acicularis]
MWSTLKCALLLGAIVVDATPFLKGKSKNSAAQISAIDSDQLSQLEHFSQWAKAAYCYGNVQGGNTKVECSNSNGTCPLVETASTSIIAPFVQGESDTKGFVAVDDTNKMIVVSIQGTARKSNFDSVLTDLKIARVKTDLCKTANTKDGCEVHKGFYKAAMDVQGIVQGNVTAALASHPDYKVIVTGHSLGAAIAALLATMIRNAGTNVDLYNYGQPHLGTTDIANYIQSQAPSKGSNFRVTHFNDPVPQLPPHDLGNWDHFYPEFWIKINTGTVAATDVDQINATLYTKAGNEGQTSKFGPLVDIAEHVGAHRLYFGTIPGCRSLPPT